MRLSLDEKSVLKFLLFPGDLAQNVLTENRRSMRALERLCEKGVVSVKTFEEFSDENGNPLTEYCINYKFFIPAEYRDLVIGNIYFLFDSNIRLWGGRCTYFDQKKITLYDPTEKRERHLRARYDVTVEATIDGDNWNIKMFDPEIAKRLRW